MYRCAHPPLQTPKREKKKGNGIEWVRKSKRKVIYLHQSNKAINDSWLLWVLCFSCSSVFSSRWALFLCCLVKYPCVCVMCAWGLLHQLPGVVMPQGVQIDSACCTDPRHSRPHPVAIVDENCKISQKHKTAPNIQSDQQKQKKQKTRCHLI